MFCRRKFALAMFQHSVRNFSPKTVRNTKKSVRKLTVRNFLQVMYSGIPNIPEIPTEGANEKDTFRI